MVLITVHKYYNEIHYYGFVIYGLDENAILISYNELLWFPG